MRSGWQKIKLGDAATLLTSGSRGWGSYYADQGALFIRMTNLPREGIRLKLDDLKFVNIPQGNDEGKRTRLMPGDILISITAELGKIGFVDGNFTEEAYVNQHVALLRINHPGVCNEFLAHLLSHPTERTRIEHLNDAGAKAGLNLTTINDFSVNLPPVSEQKKIATIFRTWDEAIERVDALINRHKQEKQILQRNLFAGKFISKGHNKTHAALYDLADWHNGLAFKNIDFSENGRPVLKIAELKAGIIPSTAFTNGEYNKNILVTRSDLLFSWSGNPDTSIDAFIWDGEEGWLNQHIFRVVPKPGVDKKYLYQFLRYIKNRLAYVATGKQSTGLGHVTKSDMQRTYIDLPDIETQQKIAAALGDFDLLIAGLTKQKEIFQSQKRGLMQKLLTGAWRVTPSKEAAA